MTRPRCLLIVAVCGLALALCPALARAATTLFDNGADLHGNAGAGTIQQSYQVSDDFTLDSGAFLTGVTFGEDSIMHIQDTVAPVPLSVEWSIGTTPFSGNVASGTAAIDATLEGLVAGTTRVWDYSSSFALPGLVLGPGTYWLTLGNGTNTDTGFSLTSWSVSNATAGNAELLTPPGSAGAGTSALDSEMAFQIFGTRSVPEPSSLALASAALALALARWRR